MLIDFGRATLEIKGYEVHNKDQTHQKHTAARKWPTAANNLGDFGKWDTLHRCAYEQRMDQLMMKVDTNVRELVSMAERDELAFFE